MRRPRLDDVVTGPLARRPMTYREARLIRLLLQEEADADAAEERLSLALDRERIRRREAA